jgi:HJR/Mrr/RecB family endonuclease
MRENLDLVRLSSQSCYCCTQSEVTTADRYTTKAQKQSLYRPLGISCNKTGIKRRLKKEV